MAHSEEAPYLLKAERVDSNTARLLHVVIPSTCSFEDLILVRVFDS